ncbi:hmg (high mobility group) box domain containing protein [Nannochloropsis oceanica]
MSETQGGGGSGSALGHIAYVQSMLTKLPNDHDLLKSLHMLMYKTPGTKLNRKKTIRAFNGFPAGTDLNGVTDRISGNRKWTVTVLKDAATLFGLEKGGDRETLIGRLVKYLNKPVTLKEVGSTAGASSKKKSRENPAAMAKKGSDGVKRTLSSYMLYAKDVRAEVVAEFPALKVTEIGSKIGEKWRGLSEEEKAKYTAKAAKLKADANK